MTDLDTTAGDASGARGIGALVGGLGLVAALTVGALALDSGTPAAATGLEQFDSCAELEQWTADLQGESGTGVGVGGDVAVEEEGRAVADVPQAAPGIAADGDAGGEVAESAPLATAEDSATASAGDGTGGTNTVVEGVDEIDVIDRIGDDRLLVSRTGVLALVELSTLTVLAQVDGVPYDARISAADGTVFVAGSSNDGLGTEVRRIQVDGDALVEDGSWSTPGYLLDARRTGDRLHVVVVDQPFALGAVPFEDGPVPCDQVWRPVEPATTPSATLVATLPAGGDLVPTAVAEITGAGGNLLVTGDAVYVVTETYGTDDGSVTSGIHRFDLATLAPTGSGSVPGTVGGPFAISEHEGHLRVATTKTGGGFGGRPIPIEGDGGIGGPAVDVVEAVPAQAPADQAPSSPEAALAEVFVLDLEGDLDVVGSTGRFGHDFETIHGVRFVGDVAYVVTFLQTDPFWVIDLADPAAPQVVGELEIPGFSGYLHPIGDDQVVGFGPDGSGRTSARLFDVSDPSAPEVVDELTLGDDSPVAYDHHAFVPLGATSFAVPVTEYPTFTGGDCFVEPAPVPLPEPLPTGGDAGIAVGEPVPGDVVPVCEEPVAVGGSSGVAVVEVTDGRLDEVERPTVDRPDLYAERAVQAPDGTWIVLGYDRLASTVGGRELVLPTA